MIITVTLNPALDKTANVDTMKTGGLNRLHDLRLDAGGKGLNVSSVISALGGNSIATGFAGGGSGEELLSLVSAKGLNADFLRIAGVTRTNLKVIDSEGELTELNEPGPKISAAEWLEMERKLSAYAKSTNTIILSGSLPSGLGIDTYQKLTTLLRRSGAEVFLDADGEALKLALKSAPNEIPNYIKPNRYELLQYFNRTDNGKTTEAELVELCCSLLEKGVQLVALSMGIDGALFVSANGTWRAQAVAVQVKSTVGAGDSMTAALAYGFEQGLDEERCFALAMAASAGACTTEGTNPPERTLVNELLSKTHITKIG